MILKVKDWIKLMKRRLLIKEELEKSLTPYQKFYAIELDGSDITLKNENLPKVQLMYLDFIYDKHKL